MEELGTIRYSMIFPRKYNPEDGGGPIPEMLLEKYRNELLEVSSGITQHGSIIGFWRDTNVASSTWEVKGESNYVLTIDAEKVTFPIHQAIFEQILQRMCKELKQQAIYFSYQDCNSFLVRSKKEFPKPTKSESTDWVFLLNKKGKIIARGSINEMKDNRIGKIVLEDHDCVLLIPQKFVEKYKLEKLPVVGRLSKRGKAKRKS